MTNEDLIAAMVRGLEWDATNAHEFGDGSWFHCEARAFGAKYRVYTGKHDGIHVVGHEGFAAYNQCDIAAAQAAAEADYRARIAAALNLDAALALVDFLSDFAAAKIDALRYSPPHGASPEDEPDPVVDAETVWAWQTDAKAALSRLTGGPA